jgi:hypothetical protein
MQRCTTFFFFFLLPEQPHKVIRTTYDVAICPEHMTMFGRIKTSIIVPSQESRV